MKYSIILIASIAFILSSCGNAKKADASNEHKHADTECCDHDHSSDKQAEENVKQEEFTVDAKQSCSTEKCAGCTQSCGNKTEVAVSTNSKEDTCHHMDGDEIQTHDHDTNQSLEHGDHTHN